MDLSQRHQLEDLLEEYGQEYSLRQQGFQAGNEAKYALIRFIENL